MKSFEEAFAELADDEGVYSLLLTPNQARATLRALAQAPDDDDDAAIAHSRLARLLQN
jgi:hypothetical protein